MREIKFRAWDKELNKLHYLNYSKKSQNLIDKFFHMTSKFNMPLTQSTGLKDKNGKDIYGSTIGRVKRQEW